MISKEELKTLLGRTVTAIGDCGVKRGQQVTGKLHYNDVFYFIEDKKGREISINENTIE